MLRCRRATPIIGVTPPDIDEALDFAIDADDCCDMALGRFITSPRTPHTYVTRPARSLIGFHEGAYFLYRWFPGLSVLTTVFHLLESAAFSAAKREAG